MKIAYFSPLPPAHTGIADYSRELLPALTELAEVDLWVDSRVSPDELPDCTVFNYVDKPGLQSALGGYDACVYQMGNSQAHANIYEMLIRHPGVVVLHDFVLHHFFAAHYLEALRTPAAYIEEMIYNYGPAGEDLANAVLHGRRPIWEQDALRYPLNKRVLDHARGVIVHSDFAAGLVGKSHPHLPVAKVDLPVLAAEAPPVRTELRARYGIPSDRFVVASMGFGSAAKRVEIILGALDRLGRKDVVYLLVGEVGEGLRRRLGASGFGETVRTTGYVDWKSFNDYCHLIDVGIDLRFPTMGESSASVCRMLGAGRPCVVSNLGWFAELPDDCVLKVTPAAGADELTRCLHALLGDEPLRNRMGECAGSYIREFHTPARAAREYVDFVRDVRLVDARRALMREVVRDTGRSLAELGLRDSDDWLIDGVAEQIALMLGQV